MLHIHASVGKDIAELIFEDIQYGNALFLLGIALAEQISNAESGKNAWISFHAPVYEDVKKITKQIPPGSKRNKSN